MTQKIQAFDAPNYYVAALVGGDDWTGTTGVAATVSYSFATTVENGTLLDGTGKAEAQNAMQQWANVANVHFVPTGGTADLTFSQKNLDAMGAAGVTYSTANGSKTTHAEVVLDSGYTSFPAGSYGNLAFIHEMGHAIGLKHPGDYGAGDVGPYLPASEDSFNASVMSYHSGLYAVSGAAPTTPMIYDIAAVQYLYGANTSYNAGDTAYTFDATPKMMTIWDGGGNDAVYAPAPGPGIGNSLIDLREGADKISHLGGAYVWIAFGAHIENAVGNSGDDTVQGNQYDNQVYGGLGNDYVHGGGGNDVVVGGRSAADADDGNDTLLGGLGNDSMYGNAGNDLMYGGRGESDADDSNDILFGGKGSDSLFGNAGNDVLYGGGAGSDPLDQADLLFGGKGADTIYGNGGDDTIYGGGAASDPDDQGDVIYGGNGNDLIFGNGGNDTILGGPGNDTMHGGVGDDVYLIGPGEGNDVILLFEGANAPGGDILQFSHNINGSGINDLASLLAHLHVEGGNAVIDLGSGNSLTVDAVTTFGADDVMFV